MDRRQIIQSANIFVSAICLLAGSLIYILFRPSTLLMFHWADTFGISYEVFYMRTMAETLTVYMPDWALYSLPFAMWLLSYLLFVNTVWAGTYSIERNVWFWSVPLISVGSEFAQLLHILPGQFCVTDVVALFIVVGLGVAISQSKKRKKGRPRYEEEHVQENCLC